MSFLGGGANLGTAYGAIIIGTDSALRNINILGGALRASAANAMGAGRDYFTAGLLLSTAGAAMQLSFRGIISDGMTFDKVMSGVAATLGSEAIPLMDELRDLALDVGESTVFTANEVGTAFEELAKAGVSAEAIIGGVGRATVDLAAATGTQVDIAAKAMANAMNVFKLAPEEAAHGADIITSALNESSADIHDFTAGMRTLGVVAHNMDIDMDEAAAAIAAFTNFGLRGADAGVSLARGLTLAAKPTNEAAAAMEKYGITVFDAQGKFVGFGPLFDNLQRSLGDVSDQEREAALSMIFGAEAADVMSIAVANGSEEYERILGVTKEYGSAAEAASTRLDNLSGDVEKLQGSLQTARIEIFERVNPALRTITQLMDRMVGVFTGAPPAIKDVTAAFLGLGGALASFAGAQLLFGNRIKAGISALRAYEFAFFGLRFTILKLTAILALLGLAWSVNLFGVRDRITGFADTIRETFDKLARAWEPVKAILDYIFNTGIKVNGSTFLPRSGISDFLDELKGAGIGLDHAQDIVEFFQDIHRPLRISERLWRNATTGVGDFFHIVSGGGRERSMHDFRRRMTQVFGQEAADEIASATFQMRRSIRKLRGEFGRTFGFDPGAFFTLDGVLSLVSKSFNGLIDILQDRVLPWLGPKLARGIELGSQGIFFLANHLDEAKTLFSQVGNIVGRVLTGAFRVFGQLLDGDVRGAIDTVLGGIGELTGLVTSIPLGDIAISIGSWAIDASVTLADAVAKKVGEWWQDLKTSGPDLRGYRIRLFGWDVTDFGTLRKNVFEKVNELWESTKGVAHRLNGYRIALYDWVVDQGSVLVLAVRDKVNALWGLVSTASQRLYGYAIDLYGWVIDQGDRFVESVRSKVTALWLATLGTRQKLYGYGIDLYGWALGQGETLVLAVRDFVNGIWGNISSGAHALSGYAIQIGGWLVDQGTDAAGNLGSAIATKVSEWWPYVASAGKQLAGYTIKLFDWVFNENTPGELGVKAGDWIEEKLDAAGISVTLTNWKLVVEAPGAPNITFDLVSMQEDLDSAMETALVAPPGSVETAREHGRNAGRDVMNAFFDGLSNMFGGGGGGEAGTGPLGIPIDFPSGEARFLVVGGFIIGFLEEGFATAFGRVGQWLLDITPNQIEAWIAQPDPIGRLVRTWFETLFARPIGNLAVDTSGFLDSVSDKLQQILFGNPAQFLGAGITIPETGGINSLLDDFLTGITGLIGEKVANIAMGENPFAGLGNTIYGWISGEIGSLESFMNGLPEWAKLILAGDLIGAAKALFGGGGDKEEPPTLFGQTREDDLPPPRQRGLLDDEGEGPVGEPVERRISVRGVPEVVNKPEILRLIDEIVRALLEGPQVGAGFAQGGIELGLPVKVKADATGEGPTTSFDADISGVQNALGRAVQLGNFWANQTFSATFSAGVSGDVGSIGSGIGAVLGGIGAGIDALTAKGPMLGGLANPMNSISTAAIGMGSAFGASMPRINSQIDKTSGQLRVTFPGAMAATAAAANRGHAQMGASFAGIRNDASNTSRVGSSAFRENYSNNMAAAQSRASGITSSMRANLSSFANSAGGSGRDAGFGFGGGLGSGLSSAQGTASGHIGSIKGILSSVSDGAYGAGNYAGIQVGQGLENGLYAKIPGVSAAARALAAAATVTVGSGLGVLSPSWITTYQGEMVGQGLIDGIMSKVHGVQAASSLLADAALPIVDSAALAGLSLPNEIPGMTQVVNVSNQIGSIDVSQAEDLVRWGKFVSGINQGHATTMAGSS